MTLPFLLVYLHQLRDLGLGAAGLAVSVLALAGFAGNPLGGSLADRVGSRAALLAGLGLSAAGSAGLAYVDAPWQAFAATATLGLGAAIVWPARNALLSTLVPGDRQSSAFALQHATTNVGLGAGALLAALIVDTSLESFQALYLLDAASFVAVMAIAARLAVAPRREVAASEASAYRLILGHMPFRRLWALTALIVAVGYAQYAAAFPAFATGEAGLDAHQLALAFAANTLAVVVAQLPVLRALRGRRRTSALAFAFGATGVAWMVVLVASGSPSPAAAASMFALAMIVLAIAETAVSPSAPALANDLAPEALRGRYNGVYTLAWTTGFAVGPALAGAALAAGHPNALIALLAVGCAVGVAGSLRLAHHLPPHVDRVDAVTPVDADPASSVAPEPAVV
jgi:MFS family permease